LEQREREEREKLKLLRSLAREAFDQLDQGQGIEIRGERQLTNLVRQIGRGAGPKGKQRRRGA
jgi:hypothetical protein